MKNDTNHVSLFFFSFFFLLFFERYNNSTGDPPAQTGFYENKQDILIRNKMQIPAWTGCHEIKKVSIRHDIVCDVRSVTCATSHS